MATAIIVPEFLALLHLFSKTGVGQGACQRCGAKVVRRCEGASSIGKSSPEFDASRSVWLAAA